MSFLAPLFLLGAAAVTLPVIFHLIRRTTRERTVFSSLMFLVPSPPRLSRRSRLEHILLLLLRCAVISLLALGFARPFLKQPVAPAEPSAANRLLLLVDTSASMRRANLWSDARDRIAAILHQTTAADQVALFTFAREVNPLVTFEQWNSAPAGERTALVLRKLAEVSPGWSGTLTGNALITAAEALSDTGGKPAAGTSRIMVISDWQEGSRLEPLQGYEWPRNIDVSVETLKPRHTSNASLQLVSDESDSRTPSPVAQQDTNKNAQTQSAALQSDLMRVRVSNSADSRREQFKVGWAERDGRSFSGACATVYVPPGQSRIVQVPVLVAPSLPEAVLLEGDEEAFDNTVFVVPPEATKLNVLYFGNDSAKDPKQSLYFLHRAFQQTRRQDVRVVAHSSGESLAPTEFQSASLLIVADALSEETTAAVRAQAVSGKTVLFVLRNERAAPTLARLLGLDHLEVEEARPATYAMLSEIDFRHPLFAPFADPRFSDFTRIHFWNYRRVEPAAVPGAHIVARFDTGAPAILEMASGNGRVLVLTSGWQPEDSQLALSTKFVPLLYSLLEQAGAPAPAPHQYRVGDTVPLPSDRTVRDAPQVIRTPDGSQITLPAGETNFSKTVMPGVYTLETGTSPWRFAVNLEAAESRTSPMPADELERLGAPVAKHVPTSAVQAQRKVQLQNAELEARQKLWRWCIVLTMGLLLIETWLAGRTGRQTAVLASSTLGKIPVDLKEQETQVSN